jgi:signal transduction histidine kinase
VVSGIIQQIWLAVYNFVTHIGSHDCSVVGVAQDVTEDRKHAAELRKLQYIQATQEAKVETERNMTAYFAHELRNPLGAIDSALNAMPDNLPESAKSLVTGMQLCSGFMSSIMNNLLDVRKMEEGKMILNKKTVSLKSLTLKVHQMLSPSVKPGVAFYQQCNTTRKDDWVLADEHRIQQVMTNVITNAIKYTVNGSISISVCWEDKFVKFECVDTGPGIPKNEQEKLFQRFVQRGGAPGTGLGLAIAKHLVDLAGGNIYFESDPTVKAGTTCIVRLPLELCEPPEEATKDSSLSNDLIEEPLRFLIVDDVKMNRTMLRRRILKSIAPNCVVSEAATGEEALQICGKEAFDVIIVDQYMEEAGGVMVGTDVVYAMRRMRIKSIIIGCSGNDLENEFSEAGADWVWQKPIPSNQEIVRHLRLALAEDRGD